VHRILVVDDSRIDQGLVKGILSADEDLVTEFVDNGKAGVAAVAASRPDLVLTDMVMPEMDGLTLVRSLHESHPRLPVILMTSQGSEALAVEALHAGAAHYVPKASFGPALLETVHEVLEIARERQREEDLFGSLLKSECTFEIGNDLNLVRPLVKHLQRLLSRLGWCAEAECTQVGVALSEAIQNGLEHGNLEINSELRNQGLTEYLALLAERCAQAPFRERRLRVEAKFGRDEARFRIHDEGPGFDPSCLPDPRDPANLERLHGRGLLLMRTFMDEVSFSERGNEVVLVKRRPEDCG